MSRFPWFMVVEVCVVVVALSGCGNSDAPEATPAEATVIPSGAAPVAAAASLSTLEDQSVSGNLHATDADSEVLRFAILRAPVHATVTIDATTGAFTLQPDANYSGADAFEVAVTDGHGNAASARVEVEVVAQRDPPVIDTSAMASVVAAGRDAQLKIAVSDPDGDAVTFSVSQVGGTLPLPDLRATGQDVRFLAPDIGAATTVELLLEATDRTGLLTQSREIITLSPVSPTGRLFTVQGRPRSDGLHWVITGDGFTANQQQDLMRAAIAMAKGVAGAPELARHAEVLNVHVLTAVSRDSGVTSASRAHSTAFEASVGCGDVQRVACVNWDKIYIALLAERAPFDHVAVVLNTDTYIGSTSASGLIVSRHSLAPASTLHEMGHLLAGLGDEYVDETLARTLVPQYREGQFPNVTTASDPAQIPWRHWFTDPARIPGAPSAPAETGVGHFEGAFYSASGFYRPKQDSIMRSLHGALGEVNTEAWLRALYRAAPPVSAAYPAQRIVAGPAHTTLEFEIVSPWPSELMAARWFVDGIEVEQARGAYRHVLHADGGQHEVRVSIEDSSGRIRAPGAREHVGSVAWFVSNEPRIDAFKAQIRSPRIGGWIRMRVDASGHGVLGSSVSEPQRGTGFLRAPDEPQFEYALYDGGGAMLSEGRIADPRVIHGPLALPGAAEAGHSVQTLQSGYYLIGIPEGADARRLRIRQLDGSMEKAAQSEQWLEL